MKVISVTSKIRKIDAAKLWVASVALLSVSLLASCETVQQGGPDSLFPPGVLGGFDPTGPLGQVSPNAPSPNVGLLLPLSGPHARVGKAMLNAAQLALFDISGDEFRLIVRDTRGTEAGAREAARAALDAGASLILGPLFGSSVEAVTEEARMRRVNVIAFTNDVKVAGSGVFVMGLAPGPQVQRVISYATLQGLRRYAVFAPSTPYGQAVITAMYSAVARNGDQLSRIVSYDPTNADPSAEVQILAEYESRHEELVKLREELEARGDEASKEELERLENFDTIGAPDFEAIMIPLGGKTLMTIAPLLAYYDIDPAEVRFLGTTLWDDARLGSEVTLREGWFAAPAPAMWQEFSRRYAETYGGVPVRIASLAYDATALAAVLSRRALQQGLEPDFAAATISQQSGFAGIDGIFRFRPNGEVERGLAVLEMAEDGIKVLDPAPVSFEKLVN